MKAQQLQRHGSRRGEAGFTLPELMIVIAIMGILAAIAIPSWFGIIESRRVTSATNQVLSDLRLSHTRSTNQLTEYRVAYVSSGQINCAGSSATDPNPEARPDYCLLRKNGGSWQQTARYLPERTVISSIGLSTDAVISTLLGSLNAKTIQFNANGTAASGGGLVSGTDIKVTIASDDGNPSSVLDVNPATSRVKID